MTDHPRRVIRALLSVSDKSGLIEFARALAGHGVDLVSTGGTAKANVAAGLKVRDVSELTGFPEMMDGRVKTLHPKVHGGLLAIRDNAEHAQAMKSHGIAPIDLLVVNLYPFEATVDKGAGFEECIENIDIGGPAMIRAAAKNHDDVAVVVEAQDYQTVLDELAANQGATTLTLRRRLAAKAYARTAAYDAAISNWFAQELKTEAPDFRAFGGRLIQALRYGENPHQTAAFYRTPDKRPGVATARQLQGKELSYNNINDTDAAYECLAEFDATRTAACVIVKHANPCGVAEGTDLISAYRKALACDSTSAYGGIVALNRTLDTDAARAITEIFTEVIIAPDFEPGALKILTAKKNQRLLRCPPPARSAAAEWRPVSGGMLLQSADQVAEAGDDPANWQLMAGPAVSEALLRDLAFGWKACRSVKSNAILLAAGEGSVGIGMGQVNRVDAARLAVTRAGERARGSAAASDAYFPFPDGLLVLAEAGVRAVAEPGGSIRDDLVIEAAGAAGISLYFTGVRHFLH